MFGREETKYQEQVFDPVQIEEINKCLKRRKNATIMHWWDRSTPSNLVIVRYEIDN